MSRTLTTLALLAVALAITPPVPAADAKGNYAVFGAGRISCNTYLNDRRQEALDRYKAYSLGYLTAWNALSAETYSVSGDRSLESILGLVADYCEGHRVEGFERALRFVVTGFNDSRVQAAPEPGRGWGR